VGDAGSAEALNLRRVATARGGNEALERVNELAVA
jgi:hypothetical protein